MRFPGVTVPALKLDGSASPGLAGDRAASSTRSSPSPPLYPADPEKRRKVEEAEAWGDEFQQKPRGSFSWWAFKRDRAPMATSRRAPGSASRSGSP